MKKVLRFFLLLTAFWTLVMVLPVSAQAPPPPDHSQNGNQTSPGGSGCPLDKTQSILVALVISLGYAGFALFQRNKKVTE
jgi:hypothetical protein